MMLKGKKITVGVTGGIAAYKAADIISWLKNNEADIQVAMTPSACKLISPVTLKVLSGRVVVTDIWDESSDWHVPHINISDCELYLLVPATANIIAKAANGIADESVSASLLATKATVLCAPAMHTRMYENPATQKNLETLKERGWIMIEPDSGRLACGDVGKGRLADIEAIKNAVLAFFNPSKPLSGKKVLVSAGPTYEYIDPVRFIGNRSSGKMGYALAEAAMSAGAEVALVSGPVHLTAPPGIRVINVVSALEMETAVKKEYTDSDIVIMAAAVADYRPEVYASQKLKKDGQPWQLKLIQNPDILADLGKDKGRRFLVGFAAETQKLDNYARKKLREKHLDLIIANDVSREDAGFNVETNIITAYYGATSENYPCMSKKEAAEKIIELIVRLQN